MPKVGGIFSKIHREVAGKLKTVTITKNPDGKYYASLLFEDDLPTVSPSSVGKAIGLDLGLTDFIVTSDSSKIKQPKWMKKREKNLSRKQQNHHRKVKGSKSRDKARLLVAKTHSKVARCREDFLHKLSRAAVATNSSTPKGALP